MSHLQTYILECWRENYGKKLLLCQSFFCGYFHRLRLLELWHLISKAFNMVWHTFLLDKRKSYLISGQVLGFKPLAGLQVVLEGKSAQEYLFNAGVPRGYILGPALFILYINGLLYDAVCNIATCADDTTLNSKCDQAFDLWQQLVLFLNLNLA